MGGRLYGLDALRGIAAVAVALHHFARIYHLPLPPLSPSIAVDLFFILSGFVMTRTYEARLHHDLTTIGFLGLRYRRLFMPLAVGSTIGLALALAKYGPSIQLASDYLLILCFLPALEVKAFRMNGPAWSLFVEILCNVLHGLIFSKISNTALLVLAVTSGLLSIFCVTTDLAVWTPSITSIIWLIPRDLACYLVGIWMFRRFGDEPLGNRPGWAVAAFVVALGLASINLPLEFAVLIACPFIIRASLGLQRMQWAIWAGSLSYPLYATHVPVMQASRDFALHPLTALVLATATAIAVTLVFETKRRSKSRRPAGDPMPIPRPL
ncbi:MAG: acyltransferase [Mesorhizobium sp.]|nr:MAG: acyltransferase [Mesorhizobium sp.]